MLTFSLGSSSRDTALFPAYTYTVIRFVADNPGLWSVLLNQLSHPRLIADVFAAQDLPLPPGVAHGLRPRHAVLDPAASDGRTGRRRAEHPFGAVRDDAVSRRERYAAELERRRLHAVSMLKVNLSRL